MNQFVLVFDTIYISSLHISVY